MKGYKIYLDDERFPRTKVTRIGRMLCMFAELFGLRVCCGEWTIARNEREFISLVEKHGLPVEMSFDHDLGDNEPTGYDIVKWLINEKQYDLRNVKINVHSANSVGRENMEGLIRNWNRFLNVNNK